MHIWDAITQKHEEEIARLKEINADLLAACEESVEMLSKIAYVSPAALKALHRVQAAIARAKGETP